MKPQVSQCAPRARGDGPGQKYDALEQAECSPRTRGWSPPHRLRPLATLVLPAHAGMVPGGGPAPWSSCCAPRARGDGPRSPSTRLPPMTCSPRTRGWSHRRRHVERRRQVLPAHAGMVPRSCAAATSRAGAPRARGDGPQTRPPTPTTVQCSPRTRGWSLPAVATGDPLTVLPAHAGMVPAENSSGVPTGSAPRARGDGPSQWAVAYEREGCSPRTRGWSRTRPVPRPPPPVLPAHAGMVPLRSTSARRADRAPRARGNGPE